MGDREKIILIVDDDTDYVESLSSFLRANGYAVRTAGNGREGLKLAKMQRPDLIIMDLMMDERTEGLFTVQEMRRAPELKSVPILVATSLFRRAPNFDVSPEPAWMAHDGFFPKPVDLPRLLAKIGDCIGAGGSSRDGSGKEVQA